jgi:hypothetical protein
VALSCNHCCSGKAKLLIFWVCLCSLRCPKYNAHAPNCHPWPARLYYIFPLYRINGTIFEKMLLNIKCVFWFSLQLMPETFLILGRTVQDTIINEHASSCKVTVILVRFWWNLNFHDRFSKDTEIWNLIKIRTVRAELIHTDWRTDGHTYMTKLTVAFRSFPNAPINEAPCSK